MKEFKKVNKVFIKSNNTTTKIFNRYLFCLLAFVLLIIICNLIYLSPMNILNLLKGLLISFITCIIVEYIFSLNKKNKDIRAMLFKEQILSISILLGLFSINSNLLTTIIASIITIVIKNIFKNITLSSALYGILFTLITNHILNPIDTPLYNLSKLSYIDTFDNIVKPYGTILSYALGLKNIYLSPILSIAAFVYLFHKKSIKYNIVFSYILTFSFIMLMYGIFNGMNVWYVFFQLTTGNILFLTVFCSIDYPRTPITLEGQTVYGIILGIISSILRFIVPELSIVITFILGPLLLTKIINAISFKLKYNQKFYYMVLSFALILKIITIIILNIIK